MSSHPKAIPDGSTVLIVGAASFIGAHIVQSFLEFGYKVRATDYDLSKAAWLTEDTFKSYATTGALELIVVPDITTKSAFEEVAKGVSAIIYVASVEVKFDPNETIPQNVTGMLNALQTATKEASIQRVIVTSSYGAAFTPNPDPSVSLDATSWNEPAVARAWAPPPYDMSRYSSVYMASKVAQEQALWKFVKEEKPSFTVNTVLPSWVTGKVFNKVQNPSSTSCMQGLFVGDTTWLRALQIRKFSLFLGFH
jgi:nucleoside-diphosphate-sugar epimerase